MSSKDAQIPSVAKPGRIDRAGFDRAIFPSVMDLQIRFDDLDVLWHVNNVAIIALLQEARVHFNRSIALPPLGQGQRTVVAAMNVEYASEMIYPGTVEVRTGILGMGRSSYTFAQVIRQNGQSAVYSQIAMVVTDPGGPAAISDVLRQAIENSALMRS